MNCSTAKCYEGFHTPVPKVTNPVPWPNELSPHPNTTHMCIYGLIPMRPISKSAIIKTCNCAFCAIYTKWHPVHFLRATSRCEVSKAIWGRKRLGVAITTDCVCTWEGHALCKQADAHPSPVALFIVVLRPSNIDGHIRTGTDLSHCTLMATL